MSSNFRIYIHHTQVSGVEGVDLQATAIWTSRQPPPYTEKANLQRELRLRMSEHLFHTTKEEQYKINPLTGAGDLCVLGTVVEFITEECGLIKMEGTQDSRLCPVPLRTDLEKREEWPGTDVAKVE